MSLANCMCAAIEGASRHRATGVLESLGYATILNCTGQSHHKRGIVELRLHYLESATFDRLLTHSTSGGELVIADRMDDVMFMALLRESTRDLPVEITPEHAEPFTL